MEMNPYQAPTAVVAEVLEPDNLAGRGARFGAMLIDTLIAAVIVAPLMFGTGVLDRVRSGEISPIAYLVASSAAGFVLFALLQAYPLAKSGQTWGKRAVGIRITRLDGGKPTLASLLLKRYLPMQVAPMVPIAGNLMIIVDLLFIFRADRRCVHDLIAGTKVVNA